MPALAHIGIGLAAKRVDPKMPTWMLLVSVMLIDIIAMFLYPFGNLTPWSHGLLMSIIWTVVAIVIIGLKSHDIRTALFIGVLIFSHWVLDFIGWPMSFSGLNPAATGVPILLDMTLTIGLGVYSTIVGALIMDLGVFIIGLVIYIRTPKDN